MKRRVYIADYGLRIADWIVDWETSVSTGGVENVMANG